jgi:hypothetical protein
MRAFLWKQLLYFIAFVRTYIGIFDVFCAVILLLHRLRGLFIRGSEFTVHTALFCIIMLRSSENAAVQSVTLLYQVIFAYKVSADR